MITPNKFVKILRSYSGTNVFNPYTDKCVKFDRYNAQQIRARNLYNILSELIKKDVDALWLGRDLGHKGGRRTGLALTDEAHIQSAQQFWNAEIHQATKGSKVAERTAKNIWQFMASSDELIFTWNIFPFHPFEKGNPFSNRSHTSAERDAGLAILKSLIQLLEPNRIIAIGNDAYLGSQKIFTDEAILKVRHPSYGGEKEFREQMSVICSKDSKQVPKIFD